MESDTSFKKSEMITAVDENATGQRSEADSIRHGARLGNALIRGREAFFNALTGAKPSLAINHASAGTKMPADADLAARLKQTLDDLKWSFMDEPGAVVDYAAMRDSQAYTDYKRGCQAALSYFKPDSLPGEKDRRAFWINLYNALVLDAVISFAIGRSVIEGRLGIVAFFRRAAYQIDGHRVSLEDIEHGILRANRGNPFVPGPHFAADDPRLAWTLPLDPRLHFALNCGGRSCPPIRSYSAEKLDQQLDVATRGFLATTVEIRPEKGEVYLSRILKWYGSDFGGREGVMDILVRFLPDGERRNYLLTNRSTLSVRYSKYDWRLNGI